MERVLEQSLG